MVLASKAGPHAGLQRFRSVRGPQGHVYRRSRSGSETGPHRAAGTRDDDDPTLARPLL